MWFVYTILGIFLIGLFTLVWLLWPIIKIVLAIIFGIIFAAWMFSVSYFVIGTLCPWCLTTDVATLLVVWALTRYNILEEHLYLARRAAKTAVVGVKKNFDTVFFIAIAAITLLQVQMTKKKEVTA